MSINKNEINNILSDLKLEDTNLPYTSLIDSISYENNKLVIIFCIDETSKNYISQIKNNVEKKLKNIIKKDQIHIIFTSNKIVNNEISSKKSISQKLNNPIILPNIKKIILVSSGKGGVGKSTSACITALGLISKGYKVGILDADIHGPSIPILMEIENIKPEIENNYFIPPHSHSIPIMSIGFLVPKDGAIAWRGPMISKALNQLLFSTKWGNLDYLIVDMPPGTGDIHLTMSKLCDIHGAIMVSTPDNLSLSDVARAIDLYKILGIKILGMIENFSFFLTDNGKKIFPFGTKFLENYCSENNIDLIAKFPLIEQINIFNCFNDNDFNLKIEL